MFFLRIFRFFCFCLGGFQDASSWVAYRSNPTVRHSDEIVILHTLRQGTWGLWCLLSPVMVENETEGESKLEQRISKGRRLVRELEAGRSCLRQEPTPSILRLEPHNLII